MFNQLNIIPRWIILILDLLICSLSLTFCYLIKNNFYFSKFNFIEFGQNLFITFVINIIVFLAIKTYAGIISYTSAQDSFRILFAVTVSNFIFYLSDLCSEAFGKVSFVSIRFVVINVLICFLLMVAYRIIAKYFFLYIKNLKLDTKKVIIYGVGEAGVAAKRIFDHDSKINKNIIAFVDDDPRKVGNTIFGIKILDAKNLPSLIAKHELDEIIFATPNIPLERKNKVVDICLENNVKVLSIPSYDALTDGKLQSTQIQTINIEELLNRETIDIDITSIQHELKEKRILITGAAGSIGSEIVRQLLKFEIESIILCDQSETGLHNLHLEIQDLHVHSNFNVFVGDVKDVNRMQHLFETFKPNYVYHAAAYKHVPIMEDNASEAIKTNVLGTKIIADLSIKYCVQKFVMISTDKAVNPTNVMGASKRIAEIYVQSLNSSIVSNSPFIGDYLGNLNINKPITRFITTRFGNVLGSNGSVIPRFKQQIEKGGPVTVTHPEMTRYFMTIPEACRLVLEAGCMGKGSEIYVFDMGKPVKIIDLAKRMIRLVGLVPEEDIKLEFIGLRPGEKLFEELLSNSENTIPTHHEKIMIGKVREYCSGEIENQILNLIQESKNNDNFQVVKLMKQIVHEFKSNNSIFEELDFLPKAV